MKFAGQKPELDRPEVWYHGTTKAYKHYKIQPKPIDPNYGIKMAADEFGHYFAKDPKYAEQYVRGAQLVAGINHARPGSGDAFRPGANIRPVHLKPGRVLDLDFMPASQVRDLFMATLRKRPPKASREAARQILSEKELRYIRRVKLKATKEALPKSIHPDFGNVRGGPKDEMAGNPHMVIHQLEKSAKRFLKRHGYDSVYTRREGFGHNEPVMTVLTNRQIRPAFGTKSRSK
jgi:hypothetical protein